MDKYMSVIEEIRKTIQLDISLHEQLMDILLKERDYISGADIAHLNEHDTTKLDIEQRIEHENKKLAKLLNIYRGFPDGDQKSENEVTKLMKVFHQQIYDTMNVISLSVETIKKAKKDIVGKMKKLDTNKDAFYAYAKTG